MIAVAEQAELWIGTPFRWQAQLRGIGCDCKGLVAGVARELGLPEANSVEAIAANYERRVPTNALRAGLARLFDRVDERQAGDVLLIRVSGVAQHLAIAAPRDGAPSRVIEAMCRGPQCVRPYRRSADEIDSIWRWRHG